MTSTLISLLSAAALWATLLSGPTRAATATYDVAGLWPLSEGSGQVAATCRSAAIAASSADVHDPTRVALPRIAWRLPRSVLRFGGSQYVRMANAPSLVPDG